MLAEERHVSLDRRLLIGTDVGLVVIEVDILHVLAEQVFIRNRRGRWRRRWRSLGHSQPSRCFLRSTRALRDQMISRGVGGRDALRTIRLNRANAIDRHVSGIAGLPRQSGRLPGLNRTWIHRNRGSGSRWRWRWWWRRGCGFLFARAKHED